MSQFKLDEEAIFDFARKIDSNELRSDYLAQACGTNTDMRDRLAQMLDSFDKEQSYLEQPAVEISTTLAGSKCSERTGDVIGPYKLLQRIGEGGFGIVYMAEQSEPVRRKVALKVIKPGMDTKEVIARFEAERQALAMMEHANIARVIDGGATESGRPYFVMELVKGVPLTEYCDKNQSSTEERLRLFIAVCRAVQHAHQKGVIHRDLKPSNVLVTLADGEPVVKVIDFGVAKAINQQLTEKTLFTAYGQMVGTPQYMSPEQAEMSCMDVDTRSDVYSLGVILYELLTGTTPLQTERLRGAGYAEMQRIIQEEETQKPSTRLSTSSDNLTIIAKHRSVSPERLKNEVRGDLDWIVMKSLEKDRARRYDSAIRFAEDLDRYLKGDAVDARPPTLSYRITRTWRKNRALLTSLAIIFLAMTVGLAGALWGWAQSLRGIRLSEEHAESLDQLLGKQADLLARYQSRLTDEALLYAFSGSLEKVDQVVLELDELEQTAIESKLRSHPDFLRAVANFYRGDIGSAKRQLNQVLKLDPDHISAMGMLSLAGGYDGAFDECLILNARIDELLAKQHETTPFEALFAGHGSMPFDLQKSIARLRELVRQRPYWAIAKAALADAIAHRGHGQTNIDLIDEALAYIGDARRLAPNMPFIEMIDLWVHTCAIEVYGRKGKDSSALETYATQVAERVRELENYNVAQIVHFWFCRVSEKSQKLQVAAAEKAMDAGEYLWTPSAYLYSIGEADLAKRILSRLEGNQPYATIQRIRGELLNCDNPEKYIVQLDELVGQRPNVESLLDICQLYSMLGQRSKASQIAEQVRDKWGDQLPDEGFFAYEKQVDAILADCENADDFLKLIESQEPFQKTVMAWQAAAIVFAEGDRDGAFELYNTAGKSPFFNTGYKEWSEVYARALEDQSMLWPAKRTIEDRE